MSKKLRNLKYMYVQDETGRIINAKDITEQDRINHRYYIEGYDSEGNKRLDPVIPVIGKIVRNHFRRYKEGLKTTANGETIYNVKTGREFNESMVHKLAKQMLIDGKISWIDLPNSVITLPNGNEFKLKNTSGFLFQEVKSEVKENIPDSSDYVRFDLMCRNKILNESLAIEIRVKHKCDSDKIDKLNKIKKNTVEIDLSDIADMTEFEDGEIEEIILERFRNADKTVWLFDGYKDKIEDAFSKVITNKYLNESTAGYLKARDGAWYSYKDTLVRYIPDLINCPKIASWNGDTSKGNIHKLLTENNCLSCGNFLGWKNEGGKMVSYCGLNTDASLLKNLITSMVF